MLIILFLFFSLVLLFIFYYFYSNNKIKNIKNNFINEIKEITEKLSKVAYGNLTTSFDLNNINNNRNHNYLNKEIYELKKQFNDITSEPLNRICYVGADPYHEGYNCGNILGNNCKENSEVVVLVTSNLNTIYIYLRVKGFTTVLKEKYPSLKVSEIFESHANIEKAYDFLKSTITKNPNIKGIYVTGSSMGPIAAKFLQDEKKSGEIFLICHDIDQNIANYIKQKTISATIIKNTLAQGHDSIIHLFNHIVTGWKPIQPRLLTPTESVNSENLEKYWDFNKGELLKTEEMIKNFVKPLKVPNSKIKIMIFCEDWSSTFLQIKTGMMEAVNSLRNFNTELKLITLNQAKRPKQEVLNEVDNLIKNAISEKYNGIVTYVGIKELTPYLNKAITSGIAVATYNSEPNNLRNIIKWLNDTSFELENFSNEYQTGHQQINNAMGEILQTIQYIVDRIIQQTESAKNGVSSVANIITTLNESVKGEEKQMETVLVLSDISTQMSELIKNFNTQIDEMKKVQLDVNYSTNKIGTMNEYSKKIASILQIIENISDQTKLLSLNSAVEAARAGENGKGFKVVSDEVRKLSEKSNKSTKIVAELIINIQNIINESIDTMNNTKQKIDIQAKNVTAAINNIEKVSEKLITTMNTVKLVADENTKNISEMKNSSNEMSTIINDSANKSQENSSAIEEISASIGEITMQFNEMNNQTKIISDIVNVLKGSVAQFNTE